MNLLSLGIFYRLLSLNDIVVIIDILKSKNIKSIFIYHCHDNNKFISMYKLFNSNNIMVNGKKIGDPFQVPYFSGAKMAIVVDSACENFEGVLNSFDRMTFKRPFTWIFKSNELNSTVSALSHYAIEVDSNFIILFEERNNSVYILKEIYNSGFMTNGSIIINVLGNFTSKLQIQQVSKLRSDLTGVVLKCPIVIIDEVAGKTYMQFVESIIPPHVDPVHKFKFYRVLRYLEEIYNFRLNFRRTSSWGYLRNGTFDGMVGAFQRHDADVGGSALFFRTDRMLHVDYVVDIWKTRPCFIFRHPKFPGGFYTIYTRPLSATVWYCLIALLTLAGLFMYLMVKINATRVHYEADTSLTLLFIFISSAIGQQGIPISSPSLSTKIVILSTLIFTLTLYQYYNATVVSTLLREPPKSIKTLRDLLTSKMEVGVENNLYDKDFFKRTTDPIALELFRKKIVTGTKYNFFNPDRGMAMVKRGHFAFHVDSLTGYRIMRETFTEREICDAFEIQLYPPQHTGVVLKKGSPYREQFCLGIRKMFEAGLMSRLRAVWDEPRPPCVRTPDSSVFAVNIREFSMALAVLGVGMLFAFIVLFGEILFFKLNTIFIPFMN